MRHLAFKSLEDMGSDIRSWLDRLPRDIEVVAGVPRSGLLIANLISLYRHLPVTDIDGLIAGRLLGGGHRFELSDPAGFLARPRKVLAVDDSVLTGGQLRAVKAELSAARLPHQIVFSAAYVEPGKEHCVDLYYEILPYPRIFEWNLMHHPALDDACMDIDGVLCRDPTDEENDDGPNYLEFIRDVPARATPAFRIGTLVTCRLEKYRPATVDWLNRNGITFGELVMMPYDTKAERLEAGRHAEFKAEAYESARAAVFIESTAGQARDIADITGRPVISTDRMKLYTARIRTKSDIWKGLRKARTPARQFRWLRSHRKAIRYWARGRLEARRNQTFKAGSP